jgi:putative flippase GtrA
MIIKRINILFKTEADNTFSQFCRYIYVGGLAFWLDYSCLYLLTEVFKMYYLTSATLSFLLGLFTNYLLSIFWVFNQRNINNQWIEFVIFSFIGLVGIGFNLSFMWFFTDIIQLHYMGSKIIAAGFVFMWNFFARKFLLFSVERVR